MRTRLLLALFLAACGTTGGDDRGERDDEEKTCATCESVGALCGPLDDGCGNTLDCGTCGEGTACEASQCVCVPETDAELCAAGALECGTATVTNRCGAESEVNCGGCEANEACGGRTPNKCRPTGFRKLDYPGFGAMNAMVRVPGTDEIWAGGGFVGSGSFLHRTASGWESASAGRGTIHDISASRADDLWAVGSGGRLLRNTGSGWVTGPRASDLAVYDLSAVWAAAPNDVWVATGNGVALHLYRWNGSSWRSYQLPGSGNMKECGGIWGSGPNDVWAVCKAGQAFHFDGSEWTLTSTGVTAKLEAVWGSGPNRVFAVGGGNTILRWSGSGWSRLSPPDEHFGFGGYSGVWGRGDNDVWFVGSSGKIAHLTANGIEAVDSGSETAEFHAVTGTSDRVYVVGYPEMLLEYVE